MPSPPEVKLDIRTAYSYPTFFAWLFVVSLTIWYTAHVLTYLWKDAFGSTLTDKSLFDVSINDGKYGELKSFLRAVTILAILNIAALAASALVAYYYYDYNEQFWSAASIRSPYYKDYFEWVYFFLILSTLASFILGLIIRFHYERELTRSGRDLIDRNIGLNAAAVFSLIGYRFWLFHINHLPSDSNASRKNPMLGRF